MHDPNRSRDRGDPQVGRSDEWLPDEQVAGTAAGEGASDAADDARRLEGDPAWSGSNPGLTGDASPTSGGTAEAGSGAPASEEPKAG